MAAVVTGESVPLGRMGCRLSQRRAALAEVHVGPVVDLHHVRRVSRAPQSAEPHREGVE